MTATPWWKDAGLRHLNLLLIGPMLGSMEFGYDQALISGLLSNPRWFDDLGITASSSLEGLTIAALSFGAIVALVPAAYITDFLGRRWAIILADVAIIAGAIGQSFSTSALQFLGTRLVLGFFGVIISVSSPTLLAELCHPRQRAVLTAMYMTFFYVGAITAAWGVYGCLDLQSSFSWRIPVLLQIFWATMQLTLVFFCPESPRLLIAKGQTSDARAILTKYHANGRPSDPVVEQEIREIQESIESEQVSSSMSNSILAGWGSLFSTRANLRRTFLVTFLGLSSQWVGNGIISYYFTPVLQTLGITSPSQEQGINGGLQIFNWVLSILGASLAERAGRKTLLLVSAGGMLVSIIIVAACSAVYQKNHIPAAGKSVIVFLFIFFGFYDIGFTPIPPLYVTELSPITQRARYQSLFWFSTSVALCFNQYVNPIALAALAWKYYLVYAGVLVVVIAVLTFMAPETKGMSLEAVAGLFNNASGKSKDVETEGNWEKDQGTTTEMVEFAG